MLLLQITLAREVPLSTILISQCPVGTHWVFSMNTRTGIFLKESLFLVQKVNTSHVKTLLSSGYFCIQVSPEATELQRREVDIRRKSEKHTIHAHRHTHAYVCAGTQTIDFM